MIEKFFDEKLSSIIFRKIAELVGSLHKIGLIHTNLELDNFLLDADKNLLIIIKIFHYIRNNMHFKLVIFYPYFIIKYIFFILLIRIASILKLY